MDEIEKKKIANKQLLQQQEKIGNGVVVSETKHYHVELMGTVVQQK